MISVWVRIDGRKDVAVTFAIEEFLKKLRRLLLKMFEGKSKDIDIKIEPFGMMDYHTMDISIIILSDNFITLKNTEIIFRKIEELVPKGIKTSIFLYSK